MERYGGWWKDLLQSLLLHGAAIGGAATVFWPSPPAPEPETIPIYFEVVEAAALDAAEAPTESTAAEPVSETSVPPQAVAPIADPIQSSSQDEGSVPIAAEAVVEEAGPGPAPEEPVVEKESDLPVRPEEQPTDQIVDSVPEESSASEANLSPVAENSAAVPAASADEERAAVVSDPIALNRIVPVYPRSARRKGHEGVVTVAISVAEDGVVAHAEVVSSSGYEELDAAALSAVRSARFAPAMSDGVSVRGELRLTFDFRLK